MTYKIRDNIMFKKTMKISLKTLVFWFTILSASQANATNYNLNLAGMGSLVNGYGSDGLYLGPNFRTHSSKPKYNWTFTSANLLINDVTGAGTIHGSMTRQSDNTTWAIDIIMADLVVRSGTGSYTVREDYNAKNHDLSTILSSSTAGTGVEWKSLSMTPTSPTKFWGDPTSTTSEWSGLSMPKLGHLNVAELYYHDDFIGSGLDGLVFDAWYQRSDCSNCTFQVGDTKALVTEVSQVPLPGALVLFSSGLLGFLGIRRNK